MMLRFGADEAQSGGGDKCRQLLDVEVSSPSLWAGPGQDYRRQTMESVFPSHGSAGQEIYH